MKKGKKEQDGNFSGQKRKFGTAFGDYADRLEDTFADHLECDDDNHESDASMDNASKSEELDPKMFEGGSALRASPKDLVIRKRRLIKLS